MNSRFVSLFFLALLIQSTVSAESFERGFADLAKKAIPGVVNISTFARPRVQPGFSAQDEMMRRFFGQFFGGQIPGPRGIPQFPGQQPGEGEEDDGNGQAIPRGPRVGKAVPVALGTGFIIDANEGLILTNNHVIQGAEEVKIQFKEEETDLTPAEIVGRDPELDVALLKVKTKKLTAIPLGDSDAIEVGEYVLAIGNPLGYGHTVSHGILSAKGRRNPEFRMGRYLQTDASINPGNSGGPLINTHGEVVGINNAIDARAQGIGFAIPINLVKAVLPQLKSKGSVSRGFMGVSAADMTPEMAEQLGLNEKVKGVIVSDVAHGQPADKAGLKPYDVITAVNGEIITNAQDLTTKVTSVPVGGKAKIDFLRKGKSKSVDVIVAERPQFGMVPGQNKKGEAPTGPRSSSFEAFGFAAELAQVQGKMAVVISGVEPGKPAANSGLNRGDVIMDVAGKEIHSVSDLEHELNSMKGKSVMVRVKRYDQAGNDFVSVVVLTKN